MKKSIPAVLAGILFSLGNPASARYYEASTGRFLQEDPILLPMPVFPSSQSMLDSQALNKYAYVGNRPFYYTDPLGLYWYDDLGDVSAGFGDTVSLGLTKNLRGVLHDYYDMSDSVDTCSGYYTAGKWSGYGWWLGFNGVGLWTGAELKLFGMRIAPWGNRTGNPYGRWPHYHRRGTVGPNGLPLPGEGIGRHRPWQGW